MKFDFDLNGKQTFFVALLLVGLFLTMMVPPNWGLFDSHVSLMLHDISVEQLCLGTMADNCSNIIHNFRQDPDLKAVPPVLQHGEFFSGWQNPVVDQEDVDTVALVMNALIIACMQSGTECHITLKMRPLDKPVWITTPLADISDPCETEMFQNRRQDNLLLQ